MFRQYRNERRERAERLLVGPESADGGGVSLPDWIAAARSLPLFTIAAVVLVILILRAVDNYTVADGNVYERCSSDEERLWLAVLHIRQDLKIIVFFMSAIIIALWVVLDRI
jgi:hypothetical protein